MLLHVELLFLLKAVLVIVQRTGLKGNVFVAHFFRRTNHKVGPPTPLPEFISYS